MAKMMKSLNNISRCQAVFRSERMKAEGICAHHHTFVLNICGHPGRSQEELSRDICLNKSTVTRTLAHLEEHGYVCRKPNPEDKRQLLVYPTEKMYAILPEVRALATEWNEQLAEGISEEEMAVFDSVLFRMEKKAKEMIGNQEEDRK